MISAVFKSIRTTAGLTQRQLGERLRISPRLVRAIEAGDRPVSGPVSALMEQIEQEPSA